MGVKEVYDSKKRLASAEIASLLNLARKDCRSVREVWDSVRRTAYPDTSTGLPDMAPLSGVLIENLRTKGQLTMDGSWLETSSFALEQAAHLVGARGGFNLSCTYFEKNTEYSEPKDGGDRIGLRLECGQTFLAYDANGSKVCCDREYRRAVIDDLIHRFRLPLLRNEGKEHDTLQHTSSGKVTITGTVLGDDPCSFLCEIGSSKFSDYLVMIDRFITDYSSGRLESSWGLFAETDVEHRSEPSRLVYEAFRKAPLPAMSYSIILVFFLRSLDGIDQIGSLLKKGDEVEIELCSFTLEKTRYGLSALVGRQGSRVRVYSNSKADKKDFSSSLAAKKLAAFL